MKENPKISVIMPVYNTQEEYLREAIESILNQTYHDFEFIILNDGSTNNSKEVILSYTDSRIKYYEHENKGLIGTLNRGLSLCSGEYIARMDSDDISFPERFEKQVKELDNNPNIGIVGCWIRRFPEDNIVILKEEPKYLDILKACPIAHPTVMFRKEIFDKFNLKYENYLHAEDYELWSRLIKYTNFYNIQEVLLDYRVHENSISVASAKTQSETAEVIKQNILNFLSSDEKIKTIIYNLVINPEYTKYSPLDKIFYIETYRYTNKIKFIINILGIKFKFSKKVK